MTSGPADRIPGASWVPGPSGTTSPDDFRAPWDALRTAAREILTGQPTPHLVRMTARRIATEVQLIGDSITRQTEANGRGEEQR